MVHGGPLPKLGAKRMAVFTSWGRLLAASGLTAAAFDHRFLSPERLGDAAGDVAAAIAHVRENAEELGVDGDRLAIWVFSGGGPFLSLALKGAPSYVRAAVAFYAALDIREKAPGARPPSRTTCGASSPPPSTSGRRREGRRPSSSRAPGSTIRS
jgi:acetyl esterase/lipase